MKSARRKQDPDKPRAEPIGPFCFTARKRGTSRVGLIIGTTMDEKQKIRYVWVEGAFRTSLDLPENYQHELLDLDEVESIRNPN